VASIRSIGTEARTKRVQNSPVITARNTRVPITGWVNA
jgi:hypothetical protein